MSLPGSASGALRGAVDLSSLGRPAPARPQGAAPAGAPGVLQELDDASFEDAFLSTRDVPALFVLYDGRSPSTHGAVDAAVTAAAARPGRLRVFGVDVSAAPRTASAFQVQQVPMTMAIIGGQPVPLFAGVETSERMAPIVDQVLQAAQQAGVTGTFETGAAEAGQAEGDLAPSVHAAAYDAIESGDYDGAVAAYEAALKDNPADAEAKAGLAQVQLLRRTQGVDPQAARAAAAAAPSDVSAQILVADLDLMGGHVEDAFGRLLDVIRATTEDERDAARKHLLELFEVVGAADERVVKARRALMSALF